MNIKVYTARGLAISSVAGIVLGTALLLGYRGVENELNQLGPNSMTLQQTDNLRSQLSWYLLSADLVLREDKSHMLNATLRQSEQLLSIVRSIEDASLADDKIANLGAIDRGIRDLQSLLDKAASARGDDRLDQIAQLAKESEGVTVPLVRGVEDLRVGLERRAQYHKEDLESKQRLLRIMTVLAAIAYLAVVLMSWLWSIHAIVRPIEKLSRSAEDARLRNETFVVDENGPEEVKRLTRNISAFVRTRADFLATMSHELRTPLNGIINLNELMLETELDDGQREFARAAKSAGEALLSLIDDILDFSKLQARKLELETTPIDLRSVVDAAIEILAGLANNKGIALEAIVHHEVPTVVHGDETRLRQVLINLLNNALKFTSEGSVVVDVTVVEETPSDLAILFRVEDTGIGISETAIEGLFQAFHQGDSSTTRKFGGTGLGLAICKELTGLMGGSIGVESVVDEGSTFWFTVRVQRAAAGEIEPLPDLHSFGRIAIVSDRPLAQRRLHEQLLTLGVPANRVCLTNTSDDEGVVGDGSLAPTWAILDPYDAQTALTDVISRIRDVEADARLGVLTHPNRKRASTEDLPPDLECIHEPTYLQTIRNWLLEENVSFVQSAASEAPSQESHESLEESTTESSVADASQSGARPQTLVLVAEDNPINQTVIKRILTKNGYDAIIVDNGQEAVDYVRESVVDAILMDCQMPVLDGWEATREIRKLEAFGEIADGTASPVPIIAVTANAMPGDREACLEAGMNDYLTKPLRPKKVVEAIEALLATPSTSTS